MRGDIKLLETHEGIVTPIQKVPHSELLAANIL